MKDQLITFETAKLAKEKGFNIPQHHYYIDNIDKIANAGITSQDKIGVNEQSHMFTLAPTQSLLQKWLREKHSINITVYPELYNGEITYYHNDIYTDLSDAYTENLGKIATYEEALEKGLQEALKLIEFKT